MKLAHAYFILDQDLGNSVRVERLSDRILNAIDTGHATVFRTSFVSKIARRDGDNCNICVGDKCTTVYKLGTNVPLNMVQRCVWSYHADYVM